MRRHSSGEHVVGNILATRIKLILCDVHDQMLQLERLLWAESDYEAILMP